MRLILLWVFAPMVSSFSKVGRTFHPISYFLPTPPLMRLRGDSGDFDFPSDSGNFDEEPIEDALIVRPASELKEELTLLAASCAKGEAASDEEKEKARNLVSLLEDTNPTAFPCLEPGGQGTWELIFSDTQLFRSSPFFMAGRAVCSTPEEVARYDWFCDMHRAALAISQIRRVRQIVSAEKIVSEFEVSAGAVPFVTQRLPIIK